MSNREIAQLLYVTTKTVDNHLARAYGKLGISSRGRARGRARARSSKISRKARARVAAS